MRRTSQSRSHSPRVLQVCLLLLLLFADRAWAQRRRAVTPPITSYERILIPFKGDIGLGSRFWSTNIWLHNGGGRSINWLLPAPCMILCPPGPRLPSVLEPGETFGDFSFTAHHGIFMSVTSGAADSLFWSLRARDVSGSILPNDPIRASLATEIPLVPEREFRSEIHLLNVPFAPEVDKRLRVYALGTDPVHVVVEAYTIGWNARPEVRSVTLPLSVGRDEDGVPSYPAFAELHLEDLVDGLTEPWGPRVAITVEAEGDARIWAFVIAASSTESTLAVVTPRN